MEEALNWYNVFGYKWNGNRTQPGYWIGFVSEAGVDHVMETQSDSDIESHVSNAIQLNV